MNHTFSLKEEKSIKNYLRHYYGLHHKQKIMLKTDTFTLKLGSSHLDIEFPRELLREIKLNYLLDGNISE